MERKSMIFLQGFNKALSEDRDRERANRLQNLKYSIERKFELEREVKAGQEAKEQLAEVEGRITRLMEFYLGSGENERTI